MINKDSTLLVIFTLNSYALCTIVIIYFPENRCIGEYQHIIITIRFVLQSIHLYKIDSVL